MLSKIKTALETVDPKVYYGRVTEENKVFNYIVFGREKLQKSGQSKIDFKDRYFVAIVREDYIPEGLEFEVIDAMQAIPGMRLADQDYDYNYVSIRNSNAVAEILKITFVKSKKRT